jgi:hypothetical protein
VRRRGEFSYTFDHLADVIDRWTEVLGLDRFALYVFDYGAPVGFRVPWSARSIWPTPKGRSCGSCCTPRRACSSARPASAPRTPP